MEIQRLVRVLAVWCLSITFLSLSIPAPVAMAASPISLTITDFEGGVDPRSYLAKQSSSVATSGPSYAWESPATPASDDINYWDIYSNGDGVNHFVDWHLALPAQNGVILQL